MQEVIGCPDCHSSGINYDPEGFEESCGVCGGEGLVDIVPDFELDLLPGENWRQMGQSEQCHLLSWVGEGVDKQLKKGQDRYQSHVTGFKGDPWRHAVEEAFDLLVYLYMEGRKQGKL